ncbi:MAG: Uma2 family endonuclease [Dehalococcoidia bacterium]
MTRMLRPSLDEFLTIPDTEPASEYLCGEVSQKPMPTNAHATLQGYLQVVLFQFLLKTRLGRVLPEWRCIFGAVGRERALVPDLVVVRNEHLPRGDVRDTPYLRTAPDLAIEILSPHQPVRAFVDKVHFYLVHGVRLLWVVDPATETVLVLRPGEDSSTLTTADQLDGGSVLPGFSLPVRDLFAQLHIED